MSRVLVVEDDESQRVTLSRILEREGFDVVVSDTGAAALAHLADSDIGVAIVDLRLPDIEGTHVIERARELDDRVLFIIHTAYGDFESAKNALNLGAFAYVEKGGDFYADGLRVECDDSWRSLRPRRHFVWTVR